MAGMGLPDGSERTCSELEALCFGELPHDGHEEEEAKKDQLVRRRNAAAFLRTDHAQAAQAFASISASFQGPFGFATAAAAAAARSLGHRHSRHRKTRGSGRAGNLPNSSSSSSTASTSTATATASPTQEASPRSNPTSSTLGSPLGSPAWWQPLQHVAFPLLLEGGSVATTVFVTMSSAAVGAIEPRRLAGRLAAALHSAVAKFDERQYESISRVQRELPAGLLLKGKWERPGRPRRDERPWASSLLASIVLPAPPALLPQGTPARPGVAAPAGSEDGRELGKQQPGASTTSGLKALAQGSASCEQKERDHINSTAATAKVATVAVKRLSLSAEADKPPPGFIPPEESTERLATQIAASAEVSWSGFIRPVDKVWEISSRFGPRWGRHHNGVDLAAPTGEPVLAADEGKVTYAGWEPTGFGYLVEITHNDGWRTLYGHNSKLFAWTGKRVKRGECIALVGETGKATGPHLHWEIRKKDGFPVDPAKYVPL